MQKIMIVVGHSQRTTFCEALGNAYKKGAEGAGHQAKLFVLSQMTFDPILRLGYRQEQPLEPVGSRYSWGQLKAPERPRSG